MENLKPTNIGSRIELIKHHFKLNNSEFGRIAGVSHQTIIDIIDGKTENPRINILTNISRNLGVSINWLATGEGDMLNTNQKQQPIFEENEVSFLKGRIIELENTVRYFTMGKFSVISLPRVLSLYFFGFTNTTDNILS